MFGMVWTRPKKKWARDFPGPLAKFRNEAMPLFLNYRMEKRKSRKRYNMSDRIFNLHLFHLFRLPVLYLDKALLEVLFTDD